MAWAVQQGGPFDQGWTALNSQKHDPVLFKVSIGRL